MNTNTLRAWFLGSYRPTESKKDLTVIITSYSVAIGVWVWSARIWKKYLDDQKAQDFLAPVHHPSWDDPEWSEKVKTFLVTNEFLNPEAS